MNVLQDPEFSFSIYTLQNRSWNVYKENVYKIHGSIIFIYLFIFGSSGVWTLGLVLGKEVLYQLKDSPVST
jgi:hypothetical protein